MPSRFQNCQSLLKNRWSEVRWERIKRKMFWSNQRIHWLVVWLHKSYTIRASLRTNAKTILKGSANININVMRGKEPRIAGYSQRRRSERFRTRHLTRPDDAPRVCLDDYTHSYDTANTSTPRLAWVGGQWQRDRLAVQFAEFSPHRRFVGCS